MMIQRCLRSGDNIVCHTAIPALEYMVKYIYEILLDGLNGLMANRKVANIAGLQNPTCLDSPLVISWWPTRFSLLKSFLVPGWHD